MTKTSLHTTILGHEMSFCGIRITYMQDGCIKELIAEQAGARWLLQYVGYIKSSRFKKDDLYVKVDVMEGDDVVGVAEIQWDFFVKKYDLDDQWCEAIIGYHKIHDLLFA